MDRGGDREGDIVTGTGARWGEGQRQSDRDRGTEGQVKWGQEYGQRTVTGTERQGHVWDRNRASIVHSASHTLRPEFVACSTFTSEMESGV